MRVAEDGEVGHQVGGGVVALGLGVGLLRAERGLDDLVGQRGDREGQRLGGVEAREGGRRAGELVGARGVPEVEDQVGARDLGGGVGGGAQAGQGQVLALAHVGRQGHGEHDLAVARHGAGVGGGAVVLGAGVAVGVGGQVHVRVAEDGEVGHQVGGGVVGRNVNRIVLRLFGNLLNNLLGINSTEKNCQTESVGLYRNPAILENGAIHLTQCQIVIKTIELRIGLVGIGRQGYGRFTYVLKINRAVNVA